MNLARLGRPHRSPVAGRKPCNDEIYRDRGKEDHSTEQPIRAVSTMELAGGGIQAQWQVNVSG